MSIIWESEDGYLLSHNEFILNVYEGKHQLHPALFDIQQPYKASKTTKPELIDPITSRIKKKFEKMRNAIKKDNLLTASCEGDPEDAKMFADECIEQTLSLKNMHDVNGGNTSHEIAYPHIAKCDLIIPKYSNFICGDARIILSNVEEKDFDFVVLDPPWWNKYIRRKKSRDPSDSYQMLYNYEITNLPIGNLMSNDGLIAVWCTNCANHENDIKTSMFPAWGVTYVATWYWVKVTKNGEPICSFSKLNGKQPFERLLFGVKNENSDKIKPQHGKIFISVPSALHSHKPPLTDMLKNYINNDNPKHLEVFARYLLPWTTSIGLEPLRWQHMFLYTKE